MKFSVFTVSTPEYTPEKTVHMLKEMGYDGVEWRVAAPPPSNKPENYTYDGRYWSYNLSTLDADRIEEQAPVCKKLCGDAGLEICSLTTYLKVDQAEAVEKVMRAAKHMDCRNIRVSVPTYDEKTNYRTLFEDSVKKAGVLEILAKKYEIRVNYEIHMGNIIPSASAAYRFISSLDPRYSGIIFDPGNMVHEGFENYRLGIELLGEYLAHVHVKNAVWKLDNTSGGVEYWKPVWSPFKKGYANIVRLLKILSDTGYNGYVSVEDFSNEEETDSKLKSNIEFLKSIILQ